MRALRSMSGTSLDGVDAAVIETDGVTIAGFGDRLPRLHGRRAARDPPRFRPVAGDAAGRGRRFGGGARAHVELLSGFEGVDVVGFTADARA
ncbi:MAG: hypothetical protein R3D80_14480 [Paracoccaceae bacterium]